jgi:tetratricopeptide (TPR) repeat protein
VAGLVLALVASAAYSNSFRTGFPLDNKALILQDARVHEATRANVDLILDHTYWWPIGESGLYRPVTTLSYLFNYAVLGNADRPFGYHVVNLALHIVNVLLVYALLLRIGPAEAGRHNRIDSSSSVASGFSRTSAIGIAAIWAVHPLSTEAVTNIVGRADLIAALAVLGGLLIYVRSIEAAGGRRIAWLTALAAITILGVFAKESAVVIVGVIGLYVVTVQKSPLILSLSKDERPIRGKRARPSTSSGRATPALLAGVGVALAIPLLFYWSQRAAVLSAAPAAEFPFVDNPIAGAGFWSGRLTAIAVMARYFLLIAWPMRLSADYSYAQIPLATGRLLDWVAWAIVAAIAAGCILLWRRDRTTFFWAGFALLTFLPASNLLFPTGTIMAERVMYLPSLGVIALTAWGVQEVAQAFRPASAALKRCATFVLLCVVAGFAVRTWIRNNDWQSDVSLWTATVQASPRSFKAHRGLAEALFEADPAHANLNRVVAEIEQAIGALDSLDAGRNDAKTFRLAGGYYLERGDNLRPTTNLRPPLPPPAAVEAYERSVSALRRALTIIESRNAPPSDAPPSLNYRDGGASSAADVYRVLSAAYGRLGQHSAAIDAAARARTLDPFSVIGYQQSAAAFLSAQRGDDAAIALMTGVMVTEDRALRDELVDLYRQGLDPLGCALVNTREGAAINPSCTTVRRHVCAATGEAVRIDMNAGRSAQAQRLQDSAARQFQCP